MIYSELYSAYYNAVAAVLKKACSGPVGPADIRRIAAEKAFGESVMTIESALTGGRWPLLKADGTTPLRHAPTMPLTTLQRRWLKALSLDPRIRLFGVTGQGLERVEPLFDPQKIIWYDRYSDGDPYEDPGYAERFRTLLEAVKTHRKVRVEFVTQWNEHRTWGVIPYRLEYSAADDKFRLLCLNRATKNLTLNLNRITSPSLTT